MSRRCFARPHRRLVFSGVCLPAGSSQVARGQIETSWSRHGSRRKAARKRAQLEISRFCELSVSKLKRVLSRQHTTPQRRLDGSVASPRLGATAGRGDLIRFHRPWEVPNYAYFMLWHPRKDQDQSAIWLREMASRVFIQKWNDRRLLRSARLVKAHCGIQAALNGG